MLAVLSALVCGAFSPRASADPVARITIGPVGSGTNINASTFGSGSFTVENLSTAGETIESVRYEFADPGDPSASRNLFPDMVFDPDGTAGDTTAKPFSADAGSAATGFVGHQLDTPKGVGGFAGLSLSFSDFDAGESFHFSIDVDPMSIQGSTAPGPSQSGSVSGLELVATRVIVGFHDGSSFTLEGETFSCQGGNPACDVGNVQASEVFVEWGRPPAPSLEIVGESTPGSVEHAAQTVRVTGTPGADVVLLVVEGALYLDGVPGGGFAIDPFEANSAVSSSAVTEYDATLDASGEAEIAVSLTRFDAESGGLNHLAAIEIDAAGRTSDVSDIAVLKLSPISFDKSVLAGAALHNPTTLQFGPDGRLYVGQQNGLIRIFTVTQHGPSDYAVTFTETITSVQDLPNHDDDGTPNPAEDTRQVTGLLVTGTAAEPVLYVASSDPRIGAGPSGTDKNLDTNSGVLSRLTWNGSSWVHLDLVRGLPRSEENHATNGLALDPATNTLYAASGGFTNLGAPSNNFARIAEYALAAAILAIDLDAIGNSTYDLPTLDDEDRGGPGQPAENDPFGGNNGKNQALLVPGGPVQVYSPGWRNAYDVVLTEAGRLYTVDNGANGGWGDVPALEGPGGACTNAIEEPGFFTPDNLHLIAGPGYYGGHPNPTRGNTANTFNASNPQSPVAASNPVECDFRFPGSEDGALATFPASTNGIVEYRATHFDGQMVGNLLLASFSNQIQRVVLNGAGDEALRVEALFSSVGGIPLDITAQDGDGAYPGTIWVADLTRHDIVVFEPEGNPGPLCTGADDPALDEDGDGYDNADEIDNGTNPCNPADTPPDHDGDGTSDRNDPDDDNDGQPDTTDPFAIDASNGAATTLPVLYSWDNGSPPAGGLLGLGFTGLMSNGVDDYQDLFDPDNMAAGGAAGVTTVELVPPGDAQTNDQEYGFQFGFVPGPDPLVVSTSIAGPFAGLAPTGGESMGLFVGTGDQDHYAKVVLDKDGITFAHEDGGAWVLGDQAPLTLPGPQAVELQLVVDPVAGTVQPRYRVTSGGAPGPLLDLGAPVAIGWSASPAVLAAGILSTSVGSAPFPATWDFLHVVGDGAAPLYRINAGGPQVAGLDGAGDWLTDTGFFNTGHSYSTSDPITLDGTVSPTTPSALFATERWDPPGGSEMEWSFPVTPGLSYEVRLYFAEIYNGIGAAGERQFDVAVDGVQVLDDFDLYASVGPDVGTRRSALVEATSNTLRVLFTHVVQNPKISAIEILPLQGGPSNSPPTVQNPGAQAHNVGEAVSLAVVATDPDLDPLHFDASNLPTGLSIHAETGMITGTPNIVETRDVMLSVSDGVHAPTTEQVAWTIQAPSNAPPTLNAPGDQSDPVGVPLALQLSASDPESDPLGWSAIDLPAGLSLDPGTGLISGTPQQVESRTVGVEVSDGVNPPVAASFPWTIFDPGTAPVAYRVNAGGPPLPALDGGPDWMNDAAFVQSAMSYSSAQSVAADATVPASTPVGVFQSERWDPAGGAAMTWSFGVTPGAQYEVRLYFAEIWAPGPGVRLFDVSIDGTPLLQGFDIAAEAGVLVGTARSAVVTASSPTLEVTFSPVLQNPKISALEIRTVSTP